MSEQEIELSNGTVARVSAEGVRLSGDQMLDADDLEHLRSAVGDAMDMLRPLTSDYLAVIAQVMNGQFRERVYLTFAGRDEHSGGYVLELHDTKRDEHHVVRTIGEWRIVERRLYQTL